ncbi:hypothetical protein FWD20_00130 [Candidatus Saccharibacteria bacterium]|nr:hypothetical protein [Candidatus Saccharibacteria bacterium]
MDEDTSKSKVNDDELNQMIAGIQGQPAPVAAPVGEPPAAQAMAPVSPDPSVAPVSPDPVAPVVAPDPAAMVATPDPAVPAAPAPAAAPTIPPELDNIKRSALAELRPLVDRLTLPPEERFNTILLIIRSTDDTSLIPVAYETARTIPDENRRAQALLDVIKEVDFFGQQHAG